jgi:hypothetical protein
MYKNAYGARSAHKKGWWVLLFESFAHVVTGTGIIYDGGTTAMLTLYFGVESQCNLCTKITVAKMEPKKGASKRILPSVLPPNTLKVQRAHLRQKCKLDCRKKLVGKTVQEFLSLFERALRVWTPNRKVHRSARERRFKEKKNAKQDARSLPRHYMLLKR